MNAASCTSTSPATAGALESPDIPGLIGGSNAYDPANAEEAAKFALTCAAEEQASPAPTDLIVKHYVSAGSPSQPTRSQPRLGREPAASRREARDA
jgi:hypothetical protein